MAGLLGLFWMLMIAIILTGTVLADSWRLAFEQCFEEIMLTADFSQVMLTITGFLFVIDLAHSAADWVQRFFPGQQRYYLAKQL